MQSQEINMLKKITLAGVCAALVGFVAVSVQAVLTQDYLSVSASHSNLTYSLNEIANFRLKPEVRPENSEDRIVFEAYFQNQRITLSGANEVFTYSSRLTAYGNYTFKVQAFLENGRIADSIKESLATADAQLAEIQRRLNDGSTDESLIREKARLLALKEALQRKRDANHQFLQEKSVTVSVPNPLPAVSELQVGIENSGSPYYVQIRPLGLPAVTPAIQSLEFNFGDGKTVTLDYREFLTTSFVRHLYRAGEYDIKVTPMGADGLRGNTFSKPLVLAGQGHTPTNSVIVTHIGDPTSNTFRFDASGTLDPDGGSIQNYHWNFGDGTEELYGPSYAVVEHTFSVGTFQVNFRAAKSDLRRSLTILRVQSLPGGVAVIGNPVPVLEDQILVGTAPFTAHFDASRSFVVDNPPISRISWDFADGMTGFGTLGEGPAVGHTYTKPGVYHPIVKVLAGSTTQQTLTVIVEGAEPIAPQTTILGTGTAPRILRFEGFSPLAFEGLVDSSMSFWNFGDGTGFFNGRSVVHNFSPPLPTFNVTSNSIDVYGNQTVVSKAVTLTSVAPTIGLINFVLNDPTYRDVTANFTPGANDASLLRANFDDGSPIESFAYPTAEIRHTFPENGGFYIPQFAATGTGGRSTVLALLPAMILNGEPPTVGLVADTYAIAGPVSELYADASYSRSVHPGPLSYYWEVLEIGGPSVIKRGFSGGARVNIGPLQPGVYYAGVYVADVLGNVSAWGGAPIRILNPDSIPSGTPEPVADFTFSSSSLTAAFDPTSSSSEDLSFSAAEWDFGDGVKNASYASALLEHKYESPGTYQVTLKIQDQYGAVSTKTKEVVITGSKLLAALDIKPYLPQRPNIPKERIQEIQQAAFEATLSPMRSGCSVKNKKTFCQNGFAP